MLLWDLSTLCVVNHLSVVHIKSTVDIQIIRGLLQCYSIVKNTLKNFYLTIFMAINIKKMNETIKTFYINHWKYRWYLKNLLILKRLKWSMTVKLNVTNVNRTNKGEGKWTKKLCIGVAFVCLKWVLLINKLSFTRNWCFVLAVSRIEKQSREQAYKQSADDIKCSYIYDFLYLPKCSSILVVRFRCVWPT